jgi:hypothetical protein
MKITFVIISISDRVKELNDLIKSIMQFRKFDGYDINLLFQDNKDNLHLIENKDRYSNIIVKKELLGCHGARVHLLREADKYDIYINLDDDMLLTEYTSYNASINKALEKETGFVLTNWAKTESLMLRKVPKMKNKFVKQALVYQGGGMVYSEKIAQVMRRLKPIKSTFDTEWSLTSYLLGYTNYRYLGSLAIHMVCGVGGMSEFMKNNPAVKTLEPYVNYRRSKKQNGSGKDLLIPLDSDLTQLAKDTHKQNRFKL